MEIWRVLSDQGILKEELPPDFNDALNECNDTISVVEAETSSDANKSAGSQVQSLQTASNEESDSNDASFISNHQRVRFEAEAFYMTNIARGQKLFNDTLRRNEYKIDDLVDLKIDDLVDLKIDKVDRANVTPKVLPCKIILVRSASNDMDTYQICTTIAIISSRFQAVDLLNLSNCNFHDLYEVDPTTLPTMTFIQACKAYLSAGLITPTETCNCNTSCSTKKCHCRAAKIQCSTKCKGEKADFDARNLLKSVEILKSAISPLGKYHRSKTSDVIYSEFAFERGFISNRN